MKNETKKQANMTIMRAMLNQVTVHSKPQFVDSLRQRSFASTHALLDQCDSASVKKQPTDKGCRPTLKHTKFCEPVYSLRDCIRVNHFSFLATTSCMHVHFLDAYK